MLKLNALVKDGDDLPGDRGDEVAAPVVPPLTDEEKKLAEDVKNKKAAETKDKDKDEDGENKEEKDTRIPLARHKQILEGERTERMKLEAKLSQFQRGEDVAATNEEITKAETKLLELEGSYAKLLTDGKPDEAAKVMAEIRKTERVISNSMSDLKAAAAESRAYERARYDVTVERVEAAYPVLNPDNKDDDDPEKRLYNPAVVKKVLSVARAYQGDGLTPSAALQEAVKDLLGTPETRAQKQAVDVKPNVDEAAAKKAAREEEARNKAVAAAGKQPASLGKTGHGGDALGAKLGAADVMKMTQADFAKLDESELSRMRGDMLE